MPRVILGLWSGQGHLSSYCFRNFEMKFNDGISIIGGNNEEGKSTILEALQLALTGMLNGKTLFDIYESLFNREAVKEYLKSLQTDNKQSLSAILIEVYLTSYLSLKVMVIQKGLDIVDCGSRQVLMINIKELSI